MIELAFVACLSAAPASCEQRALQFTDLTVRSCQLGAEPHLAQWVAAHPGWRIERWTCQPMRAGLDT